MSVMTARSTVRQRVQRWVPVLAWYVALRGSMVLILSSVARARHESVLSYLRSWDAHWYLLIAQSGYVQAIPPGQGNPAQCDLGFFPLVPLVIRATHWITGLGWNVSGLLSTGIVGAAGAVALWELLAQRYDEGAATRGAVLVFVSPAAVVLSMVYSESYFILFVSLTLWSLGRRQWVLAGLAAAATTALDPAGMAIVAPCLWVAWGEVRRHRNWAALIAPALAPVGITWFFLYLWRHTGSFLEWFHAQRAGWQRGPLATGIPYDFAKFVQHGFVDQNPAAKSLGFVAAIAMLWWAHRKGISPSWLVYSVTVFAIAALSPIIGISPRIILRGFPLLAMVGATVPLRWWRGTVATSALAATCLGIISTSAHWTP